MEAAGTLPRELVDAARDAFVSIDEAGRVTEWNRQAERLFGWSRDEAHGQLLADMIVPPEFREAHLLGIQRFVTTGRGNVVFQRLELPGLHRSGERIELEFTIWPALDEAGQWTFHAFLHDVGPQRRAEAQLRLLQRAAVAANEATSIEAAVRDILTAVRETTGMALGHAFLIGLDGRLSPTDWWSPAPREPLSSVTSGQRFTVGKGLPGRVAATGHAAWIRDLSADTDFPRAGAAASSGLRSAFAFPIASGPNVVAVLEFFGAEPAEPDDDLLEVMEVVGTQLGRVFERNRALQELGRAAEEREAVISIVGHELRGPLSAAHAAASALLDAGLAHDDARHLTLLLDRQLARVRRLVDDLLTAQRLDAGSLTARRELLDLTVIAGEVVEDIDVSEVELALPDELQVFADPDHVAQILWNLLTNAARHGEPPIRITGQEANGSVLLEVHDAGPGVAEEVRPRLFERFARSTNSHGTGLGLAIVQGVARANHGQVSYRPPEAGGPSFVVTLPAAAPAASS